MEGVVYFVASAPGWSITTTHCDARTDGVRLCKRSRRKFYQVEFTEDGRVVRTQSTRCERKEDAERFLLNVISKQGPDSTAVVKIGRAKSIERAMVRVCDCRGYVPFETDFLGISSTITERDAHDKASHWRVGGEWFRLTSELLGWIKSWSNLYSAWAETPPEAAYLTDFYPSWSKVSFETSRPRLSIKGK